MTDKHLRATSRLLRSAYSSRLSVAMAPAGRPAGVPIGLRTPAVRPAGVPIPGPWQVDRPGSRSGSGPRLPGSQSRGPGRSTGRGPDENFTPAGIPDWASKECSFLIWLISNWLVSNSAHF